MEAMIAREGIGLILEVSVSSGIGFYADGVVVTDKPIGRIYGVDSVKILDSQHMLRVFILIGYKILTHENLNYLGINYLLV